MVDYEAATTVVYRPDEDKFLLVKRAESKESNPGLWEFPGGGVEEDESPRKAALRELKEETGLKGQFLKSGEIGVVEGDIGTLEIYPFLVTVSEKDVRLSKEHTEYTWVELEDLDDFETVKGIEKELEAVGIEKQ